MRRTPQIPIPAAGARPAEQPAPPGAPGAPAAPDARIAETVPADRRHIVTVVVEDYFQGATFRRYIPRQYWHRFESRIERNTLRALDLLDAHRTRATFFALGWVADQMPELIRQIAQRGHDIASKGYYHRHIREFSQEEFRDDCARARAALERASGRCVVGYRMADGWLSPDDLWALDVLAEEGYLYDSSICPIFRRFANEPWRRFVHRHRHDDHALWEVPISTARVCGLSVPIAGGNYFRQLPFPLVRAAIDRWTRTIASPFLMYFHVWELDDAQPLIDAAPLVARVRHYRHLDRMEMLLRYYLARYRFTSISEHLGIVAGPAMAVRAVEGPGPTLVTAHPGGAVETGAEERAAAHAAVAAEPGPDAVAGAGAAPAPAASPRANVSIVVPCYNEEVTLPYLANTLAGVRQTLGERYALEFIFVDDGSTDHTWEALRRLFGERPDCRLLRHERNIGITGALLTGLGAARSEIVCCIDCDCTYDPLELQNMIPLLAPGVDIVTASPYHPQGHVLHVPAGRLFLSRTLSGLYGLVLHQRLSTYTACFRVYRRSAVTELAVDEARFMGIAEILGRVDLRGGRIVEYPATLEVRLLGRSKLNILGVMLGHLRLLAKLIRLRWRSARRAA